MINPEQERIKERERKQGRLEIGTSMETCCHTDFEYFLKKTQVALHRKVF